jgi:Putative beta-lactamase-inhibitor-like, PepSY-like
MKHSHHGLASIALLVLLAGATSVLAKEQKVTCDKIPAAVRAAFDKAYPKATINSCAEEVAKGKTTYEIMSVEGETNRDLVYNADGTVIVIEESIAFGKLPDPVQQAVHKKYPNSAITLSEKVIRGSTVLYEIHLKHRNKPVDIVFDSSGKKMKH